MADANLNNGNPLYTNKVEAIEKVEKMEPIESLKKVQIRLRLLGYKEGTFYINYNTSIALKIKIVRSGNNDYNSQANNDLLYIHIPQIKNKGTGYSDYVNYVKNKIHNAFGLLPKNSLDGIVYLDINTANSGREFTDNIIINKVIGLINNNLSLNYNYQEDLIIMDYVNAGLKNSLFNLTSDTLLAGTDVYLANKSIISPLTYKWFKENNLISKLQYDLFNNSSFGKNANTLLDSYSNFVRAEAVSVHNYSEVTFVLKFLFDSPNSIKQSLTNNSVERTWIDAVNHNEISTYYIPGFALFCDEKFEIDEAHKNLTSTPQNYLINNFISLTVNELSFGLVNNHPLITNYFHEATQANYWLNFIDGHATTDQLSESEFKTDLSSIGITYDNSTGLFKYNTNNQLIYEGRDLSQVVHRMIWEKFKVNENLAQKKDNLGNALFKSEAYKDRLYELLFKEKISMSGLMLGHHLNKMGY